MQCCITTFLYLLPPLSELMRLASKMLEQFTFNYLVPSLPNTTTPMHSKSLWGYSKSLCFIKQFIWICIYFYLDFSPILHSCFPHIVPIHLFFLVGTTEEVVTLAKNFKNNVSWEGWGCKDIINLGLVYTYIYVNECKIAYK